VAAVARTLLRREHTGDGDLEAVALPLAEAAREIDDVLVAELAERLRRECRAGPGRAVDDERAALVGHETLDPLLEPSAARVDGARDVPLVPFVGLAHVHEQGGVPALQALVRVDARDLVDLVLHACEQLSVTGHYFPNYSGVLPQDAKRPLESRG
jgi:hypothetical protein